MTTSSNASPLEALAGLLEERRRYEGWLAQLEARRAESPAHVVERVRSDYLTRLDGVMTQLRGRASDLEASAASLRERIAELEREEGGRHDERAETELRATVGEFESEHARSIVAACDEAITRLSEERAVLSAELVRTVEVLASVAPPAEPEASPPPDHVARVEKAATTGSLSPPEDAESLAVNAEPNSAETASSSLSADDASQLNELAFLQSVVESYDQPHSFAAPGTASESTARAAAPESDLLPPPVLAAPRRSVTPLGVPQESPPDPFQRTPKGSTLTPGSMPSFMKDMPTEQVKTLKCQECGTMNYPTEWYCERCGGELAAM